MIQVKKDDLLKNTPDYENYSENICNLSIKELKKYGLLQCGGCCLKNERSNCNNCKTKNQCKK